MNDEDRIDDDEILNTLKKMYNTGSVYQLIHIIPPTLCFVNDNSSVLDFLISMRNIKIDSILNPKSE